MLRSTEARLMRRFMVFVVLVMNASAWGQSTPPGPRDPRRDALPTLTVTGEAEVREKPDAVSIRLGATHQADTAVAAQDRVNRAIDAAVKAIGELGIAPEQIVTAGVSIWPIHSQPRPREGQEEEPPRIVGYRATNTLQINFDDPNRVGPVIDAGVRAGANHIEQVSFLIKDDTAARSRALAQAVRNGRAKAEALAAAMNMTIDGVESVTEGGVQIVHPAGRERFNAVMADMAATPIHAGLIQVHASVSITYRIVK